MSRLLDLNGCRGHCGPSGVVLVKRSPIDNIPARNYLILVNSPSTHWAGFCAIALHLAIHSTFAGDNPSLDPNLEPLRPLLGQTWRGEFKGSTADKPMVDVSSWERALNGKAVRMLHSINNGAY